MGIVDKIKILITANKALENIQKEKAMSSHSYFSTEFLSKIILQILIIIGACYAIIPPNYALIAVTSLTALYMILRQIDKIKNPQGPGIPPLPLIAGLPAINEFTTTTSTTVETAKPTGV